MYIYKYIYTNIYIYIYIHTYVHIYTTQIHKHAHTHTQAHTHTHTPYAISIIKINFTGNHKIICRLCQRRTVNTSDDMTHQKIIHHLFKLRQKTRIIVKSLGGCVRAKCRQCFSSGLLHQCVCTVAFDLDVSNGLQILATSSTHR